MPEAPDLSSLDKLVNLIIIKGVRSVDFSMLTPEQGDYILQATLQVYVNKGNLEYAEATVTASSQTFMDWDKNKVKVPDDLDILAISSEQYSRIGDVNLNIAIIYYEKDNDGGTTIRHKDREPQFETHMEIAAESYKKGNDIDGLNKVGSKYLERGYLREARDTFVDTGKIDEVGAKALEEGEIELAYSCYSKTDNFKGILATADRFSETSKDKQAIDAYEYLLSQSYETETVKEKINQLASITVDVPLKIRALTLTVCYPFIISLR